MIREGDRVRAGFRECRVLRLEARNGQDGAIVGAEWLSPGDGTLPHWVPLALLEKLGDNL